MAHVRAARRRRALIHKSPTLGNPGRGGAGLSCAT
jgi:hypothetical protein